MNEQTERLLSGSWYKPLAEKMLLAIREKYGLRKVDIEILYYLSKSGEKNTSKDVKAATKLTKGHISQSVYHLQRMKLLDFVPDEEDRRCIHLVLTVYAGTIVREITSVWEEMNQTVLEGVTEEEKQVLERVALKISRNIENAL